MKKGINNWCEESRPREKLLRVGAEHLEVPELMAILIGSGSPDQDAVSLMKEIYAAYNNNLSTLSHITYEELVAFKGIGQAKAVTIMAALELARRRMEATVGKRDRFTSPMEMFNFFNSKMCNKDTEVFWVLLLDNQLHRIDDRCISMGDVKGTVVEPRMVFNYVVTKQAVAFAVAHNHPGGSAKPSEQDKRLTARLKNIANELGVKLLDHIIVCNGTKDYFSFSQEGLL